MISYKPSRKNHSPLFSTCNINTKLLQNILIKINSFFITIFSFSDVKKIISYLKQNQILSVNLMLITF